MGRRCNWPPKITIHQGSGTARVRYKGDDYPLGPAGSDQAKRAYAALLATLVAKGEGQAPGAAPLTVGQAQALWQVEALCADGAGHKELWEHDRCWREALDLFRDLPAAQFTAARLEEARDQMIAADVSRAVINRRIVRLRTGWRFLERRGHVPAGTWAGLCALEPLRRSDRRARSRPPVRPAEWADVAAVCRRSCPSVRGLLLAGWFTGARPSELFALTCGQLRTPGARNESQGRTCSRAPTRPARLLHASSASPTTRRPTQAASARSSSAPVP